MPYGYIGKILRVNLSKESWTSTAHGTGTEPDSGHPDKGDIVRPDPGPGPEAGEPPVVVEAPPDRGVPEPTDPPPVAGTGVGGPEAIVKEYRLAWSAVTHLALKGAPQRLSEDK